LAERIDTFEDRVLADGCVVSICPEHLHYFREEGERAGVYFHSHTIICPKHGYSDLEENERCAACVIEELES
jgi:hypothetical protein